MTKFLHLVYFWLRERGEPGDAEALLAGIRRSLPQIPGVLRLEAGTPAGTERDVVDNSYGVALLVNFANGAAHDVYQDHPDPLKFIEECRPLWSRVLAYDTVLR